MKIKKTLLLISSIIGIPLYCFTFGNLLEINSVHHTNVLALLLYAIIFILCIKIIRIKKCVFSDIVRALVISLVTVFYIVPINYLGIVAAVTTALVYLACKKLMIQEEVEFVWFRKDIRTNIILLSAITIGYVAICLIKYHNVSFKFSPVLIPMALAPALSEELIFRVFFYILTFKAFDLDETIGNKAWVFFVINIPFTLLHCVDYLIIGDIGEVISHSYTIMTNTLIGTILIRKYGIIYGVYQHALSDFLGFCILGVN